MGGSSVTHVPAAPGARGETFLGENAVERIVVAAIASVPGTVESASRINRLAGRGYPRVDVQLDPFGAAVAVETDIAVSWPSPVVEVARAVRATITRWLADATGLPVVRVDVRVASVVGSESGRPLPRVTAAEVRAHDPAPALTSPAVRSSAASGTAANGTSGVRRMSPVAVPVEPAIRPAPRHRSATVTHPSARGAIPVRSPVIRPRPNPGTPRPRGATTVLRRRSGDPR